MISPPPESGEGASSNFYFVTRIVLPLVEGLSAAPVASASVGTATSTLVKLFAFPTAVKVTVASVCVPASPADEAPASRMTPVL